MPTVIYLGKERLGPRFGHVVPAEQVACVREDLPESVRKFVIAHELYHLKDRASWWVWREIKANASGALMHPVGFLACVLMSLAPYRLSYYWNRITGRDAEFSPPAGSSHLTMGSSRRRRIGKT